MKKAFIFAAAVTVAMMSAGCGHNIGAAFSGKMMNVGYDPELNKFGIQYYDGVMVTGLNKEKTETHLVFEDTAESDTHMKTGTRMTYDHFTGDQVTGYVVDLAEVELKK